MILNMDENGDGKLDRIEFLTNMVYILGMCEKKEVEEIMKNMMNTKHRRRSR